MRIFPIYMCHHSCTGYSNIHLNPIPPQGLDNQPTGSFLSKRKLWILVDMPP
jgi:hypothetical protein